MNTIKSPVFLQQDDLMIRSFCDDDAAEFVAAVHESASSLERWMPWYYPGYSEKDALEWFTYCDSSRENGSEYSFGIFSADGQEFIGGTGLNDIHRRHRSSANLGYWVRHARQRQGVATRAIQMMSQFGFQELNLLRIEIVAIDSNTASNLAARKSGAHFEGFAGNKLIMHGVPHTAAVYSLIPADITGS
jgi:ribosomal-protein-serine acetyltransferase